MAKMLLNGRNVLLAISSAIQTFLRGHIANTDIYSGLETLGEQITAASSPTAALSAEKRDLNLCTEWSILGNGMLSNHRYWMNVQVLRCDIAGAYINCVAPFTCVFGDFASGYYWGCGVMSTTTYWKTACNNYPITSNNLNNVYW
jgi:hypothetical protein